ncbi:hypothetical protein C4D60_Mb04t16080 [Musa balbisiana]|uniref:Band 7 domain-containing protein n=1 Tax=Musa balbisiana TaxID=52838 RepID=A0A4S8KCJ0_MUSBA|nr:hypothetical protein C4D60_Mb04t16080 [Musa balbisiana]
MLRAKFLHLPLRSSLNAVSSAPFFRREEPFLLCSPLLHHLRHYRSDGRSRDDFPSSRYIVDPVLASYGVENPIFAVIQLAQTTMRSELGKITLDKTFEERDTLNENIVVGLPSSYSEISTLALAQHNLRAINEAASDWGLKCLRYEIRDISPPPGVKAAMEMQAEAERRKRAQVLESEGERQAKINIADGTKASVILASEAAMMDQAASLRIAEQYIKAFGCIAKEGTTLLLPSAVGNPSSMITQALAIYKKLNVDNTSAPLAENPHPETSEESKSNGDSRIDAVGTSSDMASVSDPSERVFSLQSPPKGLS